MKKYFSLFLVLALALVAMSANAEERGTPPPWKGKIDKQVRIEMRGELREDRAAVIEEIKTKREEWKEEMQERVGDKKLFARTRISVGLMHRTENLIRISDKIEARIEKMQEAGKPVGEAQSFVDDAQEDLQEVKEDIEGLKEMVDDDATLEEIKAAIVSIKDDLKNAHKKLWNAVKELRGENAED